MLKFSVSGTELSFRVKLLREENPSVVDDVCSGLPLNTILHHDAISGNAFSMPITILSLQSGVSVPHYLGTVYLHAPQQAICISYQSDADQVEVNQIGQVLEAIGRLIYQESVEVLPAKLIKVEVRLIRGGIAPPFIRELPLLVSAAHWITVRNRLERKGAEVWLEEPEEVQLVRWGIEGTSSGPDYVAALLADTIYGLLKCTQVVPTLMTNDITQETAAFLTGVDNLFKTLDLPSVNWARTKYSIALGTVSDNAQFIELTGAWLTYLNRMFYWMELIQPSYLSKCGANRDPMNVKVFHKLFSSYACIIALQVHLLNSVATDFFSLYWSIYIAFAWVFTTIDVAGHLPVFATIQMGDTTLSPQLLRAPHASRNTQHLSIIGFKISPLTLTQYSLRQYEISLIRFSGWILWVLVEV
ncbi:hypothetical protein J3R82DRAFT_11607 [Butyriboletus roseoflavus]|nr:hypothetical protein J3R82DRAFT_11607 [Butyriboletus roseoflavus]